MRRSVEPRQPLVLLNPNKEWVLEHIEKLLAEWREWLTAAKELPDSSDYNPQTCAEAVKDGWENIRRHERLREKTLVFLSNNFSGYDFILSNWPLHPHEDNLSRRKVVIPGWIQRLETLKECLDYAKVPDGYWKSRGKQLVESISGKAPDIASDIAAKYLKGG